MKNRINTSYCCYDAQANQNLYFDNQIDNFLWWNFLKEIIEKNVLSGSIEFEKHS